jgi:hypothetical protein
MTGTRHCPHCEADLRGAPVYSTVDCRGHVSRGGWDADGAPITTAGVHVHDKDGKPRYGTDMISVEAPDVYDGHLFWLCPLCHGTWHNWPKGHRLRAAAEERMVTMRGSERQ